MSVLSILLLVAFVIMIFSALHKIDRKNFEVAECKVSDSAQEANCSAFQGNHPQKSEPNESEKAEKKKKKDSDFSYYHAMHDTSSSAHHDYGSSTVDLINSSDW